MRVRRTPTRRKLTRPIMQHASGPTTRELNQGSRLTTTSSDCASMLPGHAELLNPATGIYPCPKAYFATYPPQPDNISVPNCPAHRLLGCWLGDAKHCSTSPATHDTLRNGTRGRNHKRSTKGLLDGLRGCKRQKFCGLCIAFEALVVGVDLACAAFSPTWPVACSNPWPQQQTAPAT